MFRCVRSVACIERNADLKFCATTLSGGGGSCEDGCGTVYKIAPDGTETVLQTFLRARKGFEPRASLLLGRHGFLYGTTESGGVRNIGGVVFRIRAK